MPFINMTRSEAVKKLMPSICALYLFIKLRIKHTLCNNVGWLYSLIVRLNNMKRKHKLPVWKLDMRKLDDRCCNWQIKENMCKEGNAKTWTTTILTTKVSAYRQMCRLWQKLRQKDMWTAKENAIFSNINFT